LSFTYSLISDTSLINRNEWSEFIRNHPAGNVFHTPEYFDLCNSISEYTGKGIWCMEDGKICGILISVIQREYAGFLGKITARSVVWGGPVVRNNDTEIASLLLENYTGKISKLVLFSQFRNLTDMSMMKETFNRNGYGFEEHLNILVTLSKNKESLWSDINPTRRKQINRSQRRNVTARIAQPTNPGLIELCYSLLKIRYRKAGLPLPGIGYFKNAVEYFSKENTLRLFIAELGSEVIGFRMALCYGETIYDWYAASSDEHNDKYPNDLLPWTIFCWGNENGFKKFDFGGAGRPGQTYGVRDYKIKFGGELVNFGRFFKVHKRILYKIIMWLFMIRKEIISRR
jgi:serine/alanine adding enzyme